MPAPLLGEYAEADADALENRTTAPEALEQRVDDLWRVEHPATAHVLADLGEGLRGVDKRLAKRIRTAANRAHSRR
ncbi:hypothetical protein [Streptomyces sp. DSM 40750]|uniref:hypothetical protein n=1 Tax=Streptomyces sp. DSM 40750 TaxID=2801030 RepID=UPI00214BF352|nr:hypothetical protein [Streptomyces sp. DSM 40750]UUU25445.1 hypothetical protein JIX55_37270 [Streptomyces sp. DSM 40750]